MKYFLPILFAAFINLSNGFTNLSFGQGKSKSNKFEQFIPADCRIMDMKSADLNHDNIADYVLVLQSMNETWNENEPRPLLIIKGEAKGKLSLLARNDHVVLTKNGGGVFGDAYKGISLKNGYIEIEHSVGTTYKWNRIISFVYDSSINDFVLSKDTDISYHISDPNRQKDTLYNKEAYNHLVFASYSYNRNKQ